jgi:hypothetical protein
MKITNAGLRALTTSKERQELRAAGTVLDLATIPKGTEFIIGGVKLRRSFDQVLCGQTLRFVRVLGPADHPNVRCVDSDLSVEGLKDWGII